MLLLLLLASLFPDTQTQAEQGASPLRRLRSLDASIQLAIEVGCRRSPTFAEIVDDIERSDLIIYVEQVPRLRNGMVGALLHDAPGAQYLRVLLKRGLSLERRIHTLAHELQHAREVLRAGIVPDAVQMNALFQRIGDKRMPIGEQQQYETAAALQVAAVVAADLRSGRQTGRRGPCRSDPIVGR